MFCIQTKTYYLSFKFQIIRITKFHVLIYYLLLHTGHFFLLFFFNLYKNKTVYLGRIYLFKLCLTINA